MGAVDVERLFAPIEVTPMADVPRVLDQHNDTRMFVSEKRLSRPYHDGLGWVVGARFVNHRPRQDREYGYGPLRAVLPGVTNRITDVTGYAQANSQLIPALLASAALRPPPDPLGGQ